MQTMRTMTQPDAARASTMRRGAAGDDHDEGAANEVLVVDVANVDVIRSVADAVSASRNAVRSGCRLPDAHGEDEAPWPTWSSWTRRCRPDDASASTRRRSVPSHGDPTCATRTWPRCCAARRRQRFTRRVRPEATVATPGRDDDAALSTPPRFHESAFVAGQRVRRQRHSMATMPLDRVRSASTMRRSGGRRPDDARCRRGVVSAWGRGHDDALRPTPPALPRGGVRAGR